MVAEFSLYDVGTVSQRRACRVPNAREYFPFPAEYRPLCRRGTAIGLNVVRGAGGLIVDDLRTMAYWM